MSFVGPGDVVTYLVWLEQVQKMGLGDASTPGAKERRMFEESGEFNLKVYNGGWVKCNRDADLLNSQNPNYYLSYVNFIGNVLRVHLGLLWRDNTSNQTSSPFIQSGENAIPLGSGSETIYFDEAFSEVPRITISSNNTAVGRRDIVTTTSVSFIKHISTGYVLNWEAIGRKA